GNVAHLAFEGANIRREALPLRWDGGIAALLVARANAGDQQRAGLFEAWRRERDVGLCGHSDWLLQFDGLDRTRGAKALRREAELIAEGAGERFMRAVTVCERDGENVWRAFCQSERGLRQAPSSRVAHDGLAERERE